MVRSFPLTLLLLLASLPLRMTYGQVDATDSGLRSAEQTVTVTVWSPIRVVTLRSYKESLTGHDSAATALSGLIIQAKAARDRDALRRRLFPFDEDPADPAHEIVLRTFLEKVLLDADVPPHEPLDAYAQLIRNLIAREQLKSAYQAAVDADAFAARRLGPMHWRTIDAKINLELVKQLELFTPEEFKEYLELAELAVGFEAHEALRLSRAGDRAEELLGEFHPVRVKLAMKEAESHVASGNDPEARRELDRAIRISRLAYEIWHPMFAVACYRLADLHERAGERQQAEECLIEAFERIPEHARSEELAEYEWEIDALVTSLSGHGEEHLRDGEVDRAKVIYDALFRFSRFCYGPESWQLKDREFDVQRVARLMQCPPQQRPQLLAEIEALEARAAEQSAEDVQAFRRMKTEALAKSTAVYGDDPRHHAKVHVEVAKRMASAGNSADALHNYEIALEQLQAAFQGKGHPQLSETLHDFIEFCDATTKPLINDERITEAISVRQSEIRCLSGILGAFHWHLVDRHREVNELVRRSLLTTRQRQELLEAERLAEPLAGLVPGQFGSEEPFSPAIVQTPHDNESQPPNALSSRAILRQGTRALEIQDEILGRDHSRTVSAAIRLADAYKEQGHFDRAEALYQRALQSTSRSVGMLHPHYVSRLQSLASLCELRGEVGNAEELTVRAEAIGERIGVATHYVPEQKTRSFVLMGRPSDEQIRQMRESLKAYTDAGDYLAALPICQQTVAMVKAKHGENHAEYAVSIGNEASILTHLGDYRRAEQLFLQADSQFQAAAMDGNLDEARNLHNLGVLYEKLRKDDQALPLVKRELLLFEGAGDTKSIEYAQSIGTYGSILFALGNSAEAEVEHRRALELLSDVATTDHQIYLDNLDGLGCVLISLGRFDEAEQCLQQAFDGRQRRFGSTHEDCAESIHSLATLQEVRGASELAEHLFLQALEVTWANLEKASLAQSHRQQIAASAAFRRRLDSYLAFSGRHKVSTDADTYQQVLRWKGAAFTRRQQLVDGLKSDKITELAQELDSVNTQLSDHALALPFAEHWSKWNQELQTLTDRKETLERELSKSYADAKTTPPSATTIDEIRSALPEDGSLVDIIEFRNVSWGPQGTGDRGAKRLLTAFIIPKVGEVKRVDLGPIDEVNAAITDWRTSFRSLDEHADGSGAALRRLVWAPLEPHLLDGAVCIAPDGVLALFPFAALPGAAPSSFLIEERPVANVPVPQALPRLMSDATLVSAQNPSLMVVGYVDYEGVSSMHESASSDIQPTPANSLRNWPRLKGTQDEMYVVRGLFEEAFPDGDCRILPGRLATETSVREGASQHRWLHLATHGFFADDLYSRLVTETQSSWIGETAWDVALLHPEVLSGIALAGANDLGDSYDDGLLTALEVAQLNLTSVDTAVLSACKTGLGDMREGEGMLSLQRAFHMAGARSVLSSLWSVNDRATQLLMSEFYSNVWEKKMTKIEALQAAQVAMLTEGSSRGLTELPDDEGMKDRRLPPYYWASFVLSGSWR